MVDIILLVIIFFAILEGYKKGLINMLISFVGTIFAAIIAYLFGGVFKVMLVDTFYIDKVIFEKVVNNLKHVAASIPSTGTFEESGYNIASLPIPDSVRDTINTYLANRTAAVMNTTAQTLTNLLVSVISYAILFFLAVIVIKILAKVLNVVVELPVLKQFNKLGGIVFSVLGALLVLNVLFLFLVSFLSLNKFEALDQLMNSSYLCKYLLIKYNPILMLLK